MSPKLTTLTKRAEFLAAKAEGAVTGTHTPAQCGGHPTNDTVALGMAVGIVDPLEFIDVQKDRAERSSSLVGMILLKHMTQLRFQLTSIRYAGEWVSRGRQF